MSSSPSQSRIPPGSGAPAAADVRVQALPFPYREIPAPSSAAAEADLADAGFEASGDERAAMREARIRELGRQEGQIEAGKKFDLQLVRERDLLAATLDEFTQERAAYYRKVEEEVVQLALSVARKILHREAQVDPLLLAGIARVALEKMEGATRVTLVVHPQSAVEWRQYLALHMKPGALPEIAEDPALPPGRCKLQTSMGVAELDIEIQLKEIERGLADLLAARPGEKA